MLKIDSQGYAEVVNKEEEEDWEGEPSSPDPGYSPILPLSPASQAVASDYEVPVRIAPPPPSPSDSCTFSHGTIFKPRQDTSLSATSHTLSLHHCRPFSEETEGHC